MIHIKKILIIYSLYKVFYFLYMLLLIWALIKFAQGFMFWLLVLLQGEAHISNGRTMAFGILIFLPLVYLSKKLKKP